MPFGFVKGLFTPFIINDIQDIRFIGGISLYIPLTSLCINISNIALCGIPFLAGFYSKDLILEIVRFRNLNLIFIKTLTYLNLLFITILIN